jgi:3-oxoacyl-[acyl-carrier protein] reductase
MSAFLVEGQIAIVTGAASGIGRASAIRLAEAGATVVCADLDIDGATATAETIGKAASAAKLNVSDRAQVHGLVTDTVAKHGRLDVMVNNAGIISSAEVIDLEEAELDRILGVNLKGVFFGSQAAAKVMRDAGSGSIVNMASGAIDSPAPGIAAYAMSKAATAQLTKTLAVEVGPHGVRVNAIAPGLVETGITERHYRTDSGEIDDARREATIKSMAAMSPLGLMGEPDDIAYAVVYLASPAARFVTGQILRPNGGAMMPW